VRKLVTALGYELSAIERTEDFLRELRAEGLLEARPQADGSYSLVPLAAPAGSTSAASPGSVAGRPVLPVELAEGEEPAVGPLRVRARRVAAQVGQAATGFSLLLFDILIGRGRER